MGALKRRLRIFAEHAALTVRHCMDSEGAGRSPMVFCLAPADATIADPLTITDLASEMRSGPVTSSIREHRLGL